MIGAVFANLVAVGKIVTGAAGNSGPGMCAPQTFSVYNGICISLIMLVNEKSSSVPDHLMRLHRFTASNADSSFITVSASSDPDVFAYSARVNPNDTQAGRASSPETLPCQGF